jgi:hypothetical protein
MDALNIEYNCEHIKNFPIMEGVLQNTGLYPEKFFSYKELPT